MKEEITTLKMNVTENEKESAKSEQALRPTTFAINHYLSTLVL